MDSFKNMGRAELVFVLLLLLFGLPMIVLIPPGAGYDEEDHLVRVWELSKLSMIPGQLSPQEMNYPIAFRDFAYRQQGSAGILRREFWEKYARAPLYEYGKVHREIDTKSVYSPVLLLPQAMMLRLLAREPDVAVLPLFYAARFASLLSYLVLVWLAIRLIPFGRWILLALALAPVVLFQATTITPDAISNGIGFLFTAGTLKVAENPEIRWRELAILAVLIALLFFAKLNLIALVLLPFLLIPPKKFSQRRMYRSLLAATLLLFVLEVAGWNFIAAARSNPLLANEANPAGQLFYVLSYPLSFLWTVIRDVLTNGRVYLQGWINGYGYYYWTPPSIVSALFVLGLAVALWVDSRRKQLSSKYRLVLVLVFLAGYLATVASLYLTFTPVGADRIFGVQGRYFIPLALLLLLALPGILRRGKMTVSLQWVVVFLTMALCCNLLGIFLSFHIPCGNTFYQAVLCYRPLFKDFPSDTHLSPPVSAGTALEQDFRAACNGLGELRVLLQASTAGDGAARFVLEEPVSRRVLFEQEITNDPVSGEDWYSLRFEPDWDSEGKQYRLRILGEDTAAGQGLQAFYTTQPEFDLGNLYENGWVVEEDLVLQYGCVTGLRKIWLTGKP